MNEAKHEPALSEKRRALLARMLAEKGIRVTSRPAIPRREGGGRAPLSYAQQRLWFLAQLEPDNPFYNMSTLVRLRGPLDAGALRRALGEIVRRHEVLRTTFEMCEGEPVQVVAPPRESELTIIEPVGSGMAEREAEALRIAGARARTPFDLSSEPPFRAGLVRLGGEEHLLSVVMHHVASDGWSMGVFVRELEALYRAFAAGRPSPLEELPVQYADYAVWQKGPSRQEALARQLDYWRRHLSGAPAVLELPTDRPRPPVQLYRGARVPVSLPPELTRELRALCASQDVTLFMLLLAAFQLLLMRYAGQERISVGCPVAGREQVETEGLIGLFVNTLVMYTDLSGDLDFPELLRRVRETTLGAYANQEAPFEQLVEELQPARNLSHTPLFQVMFVLQSVEQPAVSLEGLSIEGIGIDGGTSKFDLTLSLVEADGTLKGTFGYNVELFDAATVERMVGHLERLLAAVVREPRRPVSRLSFLTETERRQLLYDWNNTRRDYGPPNCLHHLFEQQARRTPGAVAVVDGRAQLTYAQLDARADRLAHRLRTLGVAPDTLVALCLERSCLMVVALLAVLKAGGAYLPLDPHYPPDRLSFMLEDAAAPVLLTQAALAGSLPAYAGHVLSLDGEAEAGAGGGGAPGCEAGPENLAYVIYTSGSTGRPKGVMVSHASVVNLAVGLEKAVYGGAGEALRVSLNAPLSFDSSVKQIIQLLRGHTLHILPEEIRPDGAAMLSYIEAHGLDVLDCTPSQLKLLLSSGLSERRGAGLKMMLIGGEPINETTWEELAGLNRTNCFNVYGPTECTVDSTTCLIGREQVRPSIGRPVANATVYVLDAHLNQVPVGVPGELHIGGGGVARGYLNRPGLTAERFIPDPFSREPGARVYRTGDLCRWLPDGNLEFIGRRDEQVKVRGFRVEPGEIEAALRAHPGVAEAVALARQDSSGHQSLVAYVVTRPGQQPTPAELRALLAAQLPDYMVPQSINLLERLPLTPSGKVDYRALPVPEYDGSAREYVAPRSELEREVAGIWQEVLRVGRVGVTDNFFELGGHSLLATRVVSTVRERLKVEVPLRRMFEAPTVEHLALAVSESLEALAGGHEPEVIRKAEPDAAEALLSRLDELSEAEVESLYLSLRPGDEEGNEQQL